MFAVDTALLVYAHGTNAAPHQPTGTAGAQPTGGLNLERQCNRVCAEARMIVHRRIERWQHVDMAALRVEVLTHVKRVACCGTRAIRSVLCLPSTI